MVVGVSLWERGRDPSTMPNTVAVALAVHPENSTICVGVVVRLASGLWLVPNGHALSADKNFPSLLNV